MKQILIFLVFLAGLYAANIYVNGEKVGGDDQNSTYNGESKNEILKQEGRKQLCKKGYTQYCLAVALSFNRRSNLRRQIYII